MTVGAMIHKAGDESDYPRKACPRVNFILAALFCLIIIVLLMYSLQFSKHQAVVTEAFDEPIYDLTRRIQYSLKVENSTSTRLNNVKVSVYAPATQLSSQQCCNRLDSDRSTTLTNDAIGNQALEFTFDYLPPFSQHIVNIEAEVALSAKPKPLPIIDRQEYLSAEPGIEVEAPAIQSLAKTLKQSNDIDTARTTYQWLQKTLARSGYTQQVRGALAALDSQQGDCTEYAYLFVALVRANGIPARPMGGYRIKSSQAVKATDYHNWAEFYVEGAWRIADPYFGYFDEGYGTYIATRIISQNEQKAFQAARYWHTGQGLNVTMN